MIYCFAVVYSFVLCYVKEFTYVQRIYINVNVYVNVYVYDILVPNGYYLLSWILTFNHLGDKTIEWDENFRLFFTTKLANPHYTPEVMGKTMIINYGVTMDGLTNQLLNVVVTTERSDLETQWADLVNEMSTDALLLVTLEDTLLRELSSSQVRHRCYSFILLFAYSFLVPVSFFHHIACFKLSLFLTLFRIHLAFFLHLFLYLNFYQSLFCQLVNTLFW